MTTFEWSVLVLVFLGAVLPIWAFVIAIFIAAKRPKTGDTSARFFAYARLLESIHEQMDNETKTIALGPLFAATIRELREYREFGDISLLFLEEINITGTKKFDDVMRTELKAVEAYLLEAKK